MLERKWPSDKMVRSLEGWDLHREFINIGDILGFVRRYFFSILLLVIVGVATAGSYVATTDPTYTARAQILIEPKIPQLLQQQPAEVNLSLDTAQIESQIAILESEKIAMMVIDRLGLMTDVKFNRTKNATLGERLNTLSAMIREKLGLSDKAADSAATPTDPGLKQPVPMATPESDDAKFERDRRTVELFRQGLDIRRMGVSYAIEIAFSSRDAEQAAAITNATAEAFVREQMETKTAAAGQGLHWLEGRIDQIRNQMNSANQAAQAFRARHDYQVGEITDTPLQGPLGSAEAANNTGATLEELQVTAEAYRKMFESFLQAFASSVNQQPYLTADARVITEATRPLIPSKPRKKLILVFGVVAGLMFGFGQAFVRQLLDRTVRSARQINDDFGLDCLGGLTPVTGRWGGFGRLDEVRRSPGSRFSQRLKDIKVAIELADLNRPLRVLGVTSASPGEGKTALASNLAHSWAAAGTKTLLIDGDTAHRVLTRKLLGRRYHSAADLSPDRVERTKQQITAVPQHEFELLPSGDASAVELMSAQEAQSLFAKLDSYGVIIVDLPPFTSGTQWLVAASQFDGLVVAVEWGRTPVDLVSEMIRTLHTAKTAILGVVLTKVHDPSARGRRKRARRSAR